MTPETWTIIGTGIVEGLFEGIRDSILGHKAT